jgi:hypothetical protein
MYAFSTTTYNGLQALVTEEMSLKFRGECVITEFKFALPACSDLPVLVFSSGLPGVVFILPDVYLYPETKEFGGVPLFSLY